MSTFTIRADPALDLVKLLTLDYKDIRESILHIKTDKEKAVDAMMEYIERNR